MVARRSRSKTADENRRAITPDAAGRNSPRSRKCLDLAPAEVRPSPLAEQKTANGWTREEFTPLKGEKEKPRMWSGEEDAGSLLGPPSVASSDIFPRTPFSVLPYTPATPRSSGRSISRSVLVSVSKRRSAHGRSSSALPDQFKIVPASPAPPMEKRVEPAAIQSSSFYAAASDENTAGDKPKEKEESYVDLVRRRRKESQRVVKDKARRAGARRSFGGGGSRRKGGNATGRRGCFHAIKKPKKKLKVNVKISQMPAMSIEIPNSKNAKAAKSPATPKTPIVPKVSKTSTLTPKMGNFALSKETSVDIEVKGGQIIYRKSNTTPLRRSPRKNMSPLKQSYFHGSAPRSRSSGKLFSPGADFLVPDSASPTKHIPSPVKFCSVSTNEDDVSSCNNSSFLNLSMPEFD